MQDLASWQYRSRHTELTKNLTSGPSLQQPTNIKMGGVTVRDVPSDKFIEAYASFLKRQGRLPGMHLPQTNAHRNNR
jgi:hypothetical protein